MLIFAHIPFLVLPSPPPFFALRKLDAFPHLRGSGGGTLQLADTLIDEILDLLGGCGKVSKEGMGGERWRKG